MKNTPVSYSIIDREKRKLLVPFIIPALLFYLIFFVYPAIIAFSYSTTEWNGFTKIRKFIGFQNFIELSQDKFFFQSLRNTFLIFLIGGIFIFAIAFLLSSILSSGIKGKRFFRALIFIPFILTPSAIAIIWGFITNPNFGVLNNILRKIGLGVLARPWFAPEYIFKVLIVAIVWASVGFYVIVLCSAIGKMPKSFNEAAKVEGANEFYIFTRITIPMIYDIIVVAAVYWGIVSLKIFELVYSFTGVFPKQQLWTTSVYVFVMGFGGPLTPIYRLGYATAVAVVLFLIIMIFVVVFRIISSRRETIEY